MSNPGHTRRLTRALSERMLPIAIKRGISESQTEDIISRAVASDLFAVGDDDELTRSSWDLSDYVERLAEDKSAAHLFRRDDKPDTKDSNIVCGMPRDKFMALPAQRRLELANAEAAKSAKARRGTT